MTQTAERYSRVFGAGVMCSNRMTEAAERYSRVFGAGVMSLCSNRMTEAAERYSRVFGIGLISERVSERNCVWLSEVSVGQSGGVYC
jgi:hypothetical protein